LMWKAERRQRDMPWVCPANSGGIGCAKFSRRSKRTTDCVNA
jgi:hypothetical protein